MHAEASIHVDAPPERVWRMVSDVTRMGEWSPICYRCEWLDGASAPAAGVRFKGYNRMPPARWWTICEITECIPAKVFEFRTVDGTFSWGVRHREMTRWRYSFEPEGIGSKVTETYGVALVPPALAIPERIVRRLPGGSRMVERRRSRTIQGMRTTLERLKEDAEGGR